MFLKSYNSSNAGARFGCVRPEGKGFSVMRNMPGLKGEERSKHCSGYKTFATVNLISLIDACIGVRWHRL